MAIPAFAIIVVLLGQWFRYISGMPRELHIPLGFLFAIAAAGLLQFRPRRRHLQAYVLSIGCAVLPGLAFILLDNPSRFRIPGLPQQMVRTVVYAIMFGGWMAALSVPWGLAFWWPPESPTAPVEQA